jgi:hypothetical protein
MIPIKEKTDLRATVRELLQAVNELRNVSARNGITAIQTGGGLHLLGDKGTAKIKPTIFAVASAATGDGIYNCYKQTLDKTEWGDTAGDAKFDNLDTTAIEVLNLYENNPEATYKEQLATFDYIAAWKMKDDEGYQRWVGVPLTGGLVRMARTTAAAGATQTISCNLISSLGTEITSGLGSGITVYCKVCGGGNLNAAIPRLADDDYIFVVNLQGTWYCTTVFNTSQDCS